MRTLAVVLVCATCAYAGCIGVAGDRITAGDLAKAAPVFAAMPADAALGFAPFPGSRRVFSARELTGIARRAGITGGAFAPVCFERSSRVLTKAEVVQAIRSAAALADAEIVVTKFTTNPIPDGQLQFVRPSSTQGVANSHMWRGRIVFGDQHSFPVWAEAAVTVEREVLTAKHSLAPGASIAAADIAPVKKRVDAFVPVITDSHEITGTVALRAIAAGQEITKNLISVAPAISRGDRVQVRVNSGHAQLRFDTVARTNGFKGNQVTLANPLNGRTFRASVTGPDEAVVEGGKR